MLPRSPLRRWVTGIRRYMCKRKLPIEISYNTTASHLSGTSLLPITFVLVERNSVRTEINNYLQRKKKNKSSENEPSRSTRENNEKKTVAIENGDLNYGKWVWVCRGNN